MKCFVTLYIVLFVCVLAMPAARNAAAPRRAAFTGDLAGRQNEEAKIQSQVTDSVKLASASVGLQSPRDILPEGGVVILGPEPYAWRVWPGGKIEFSYNSTHTWELQKSGVTMDLTAGSAPSAKVCWVVGKTGTILLTTDRGKHWKQLASPTKEDVAGVDAEDDKRASIWTVSHKQSFETDNAGVTWTTNGDK